MYWRGGDKKKLERNFEQKIVKSKGRQVISSLETGPLSTIRPKTDIEKKITSMIQTHYSLEDAVFELFK